VEELENEEGTQDDVILMADLWSPVGVRLFGLETDRESMSEH